MIGAPPLWESEALDLNAYFQSLLTILGLGVLISIVVPVLGSAGRLGDILKAASRIRGVDVENIVVIGSMDRSIANRIRGRARVIHQSMLRYPGRGIAMRDGYLYSDGDVIIYLDSNTDRISPQSIEVLYRPILDGELDLVKAGFSRRFSELEERLRPHIARTYPGLSSIEHPLSPYTAARRKTLEAVSWEQGWGADMAILLDAHRSRYRVGEVRIDLKDRGRQAKLYRETAQEILWTLLKRAITDKKIGEEEASRIEQDILGVIG